MPSVKDRFRDENTDLGIIPGGLTSVLQPLDKCITKVFKQYMKELWADWIASGEHTFTPSGLTRRPTITLVCEWIISAWNKVNTRTVIKSFKKCSISNNLDGSEDDYVYQDVNSGSDSSDSEEETDPYDDLMSNEEFIQLFDMRNDDDIVSDFEGF